MKHFQVVKVFLLAWLLAAAPAWAADIYWDASFQFFNQNGDPLGNGTIETYDAGTTNLRTTYQDSGETVANSNPIVIGSDGRLQDDVYIATGAWKFILKDANGVTIRTVDNIPGALDTAALQTDFARQICPVIVRTSATSMQPVDRGKCVDADGTTGAWTWTLENAVTAGDGVQITVRKSDASSNIISVTTTGGQTINGSGNTIQLTIQNAVETLVSDGANWRTTTGGGVAPGSIELGDLDPGVAGSLVPVGHTAEIYTGTCPDGWLREDGAAVSRTTYSALFALLGEDYGSGDGSTTFNLPDSRGYFTRHQDSGAGRDPDATARTDRGDGTTGDNVGTLQQDAVDDHTHADDLAGPAHTHGIGGGAQFYTSPTAAVDTGAAINVAVTARTNTDGASSTILTGGVLGINAGATFSTETRAKNIYVVRCIFASPQEATGGAAVTNTILSGPGTPSAGTGNDGDWWIDTTNWFMYFKSAGAWTNQTNIVGIAAINGKWDNLTADATPDTIRFNSATSAAVTFIYINETDAGGVDISAYLATIDSGTIKVTKRGQSGRFWLGETTGPAVDAGDYWQIPVLHLSSTDASVTNYFVDEDSLQFAFWQQGQDGAPGIPGPTVAVSWTFNTGTGDTNPPSGEFKVSVADLTTCNVGASCQLYISNNELGGTDATGWLDTWDDNGTADNRGTVTLFRSDDSTVFYVLQVRNLVVDGTGYRKVDFVYLSGSGTLSAATAMMFSARGASGAGDVSGPGSSINGNLASWNGVGGDTLADAGASVADIDPRGKQTVNLLAAGMIALPSAAPTAYTAELPTNAVLVTGYEFSGSVDQKIQIAFPMPESWDSTQALPVKFYWTNTATSSTGDVVWVARARCAGDDAAIDAAWGADASVTDTFIAANDQHQTADVSMTPGGVCAKDAMLYVELFRDADAAGDTYAQSVALQAAMMEMTTLAANDD